MIRCLGSDLSPAVGGAAFSLALPETTLADGIKYVTLSRGIAASCVGAERLKLSFALSSAPPQPPAKRPRAMTKKSTNRRTYRSAGAKAAIARPPLELLALSKDGWVEHSPNERATISL